MAIRNRVVPHPARLEVENRAALDGIFRNDAYRDALGAELEEWAGGWARVRYDVPSRHANFNGGLHGGAVFSVADAAFGVASNSWGRIAVALTMDAHFLAAPRIGEVLLAESQERSRTRGTASHLVEVTGAGGRQIASVHAMVHRTGRWHLGEEAWSQEWREAH